MSEQPGAQADDHHVLSHGRDRAFRLLVESVKDYGIFMLDPSGHVVSWNAGAERIKGYSASEIVGRHFSAFYPPEDVAAGKPEMGLRQAAADGRIEDEGWRIRKDGTAFWANVVITALRDETGHLTGFAKVTRDMTERRGLAEAERTARHRVEEASRAKDEFLATISHELRTPLNVVVGELWRLQHQALDEEERARAWASVDRNMKLQVRLVEDLLEVSRALTGTLKVELRPTELAAVVDGAMEIVRAIAQAKGVTLTKRVRPDAGLILGDPVRLQQVVWNLLSNALKFTPAGGAVHVELIRKGIHVQLTVSDTGVGIAPDFVPQLFQRFTQADASSTRVHTGLGLGLAIVKELVEAHGGEVSARSPGIGHGAVFEVRFPVPAVVAVEELDRAAHGEDRPQLDAVRVLVVDDQRDAREAVAGVLRHFGAEVMVAESAQEAIELVQAFRPNVLLADIAMPGEDGYSLISRLRMLNEAAGVSVAAAALTAYTATEDRLRILSAGYQLHVAKPVEPLELALSVAHLAKTVEQVRQPKLEPGS